MRIKILGGVMLLLLLACSSCSTCSAERTYQIRETELIRLEQRLKQQDKQIKNCKIDLKLLQEQLSSSREASAKLKLQLNESQKISQQQSKTIANANQSLETFAQEVKRKEQIIKRQRDIAYGLLTGLVLLTLTK